MIANFADAFNKRHEPSETVETRREKYLRAHNRISFTVSHNGKDLRTIAVRERDTIRDFIEQFAWEVALNRQSSSLSSGNTEPNLLNAAENAKFELRIDDQPLKNHYDKNNEPIGDNYSISHLQEIARFSRVKAIAVD